MLWVLLWVLIWVLIWVFLWVFLALPNHFTISGFLCVRIPTDLHYTLLANTVWWGSDYRGHSAHCTLSGHSLGELPFRWFQWFSLELKQLSTSRELDTKPWSMSELDSQNRKTYICHPQRSNPAHNINAYCTYNCVYITACKSPDQNTA